MNEITSVFGRGEIEVSYHSLPWSQSRFKFLNQTWKGVLSYKGNIAHLTLVNQLKWGLECSIDPEGLQADAFHGNWSISSQIIPSLNIIFTLYLL